MASDNDTVTGELVDDSVLYELREVCEICGVHADYLVEMVEAGIVKPHGEQPKSWRFSAVAIMRSRKALRLQRDLDINLPGLAVTLDLLERVDTLQAELKSLRQRLEKMES